MSNILSDNLKKFRQQKKYTQQQAAEILGVHKTDLIEFYDSMGIPYLDQSEDELMEDLATLDRVMEVAK